MSLAELSVNELARGWRQHVEKVIEDMPLSNRDPAVQNDVRVWGADDLAATLYFRDQIEAVLGSGPVEDEVRAHIARTDEMFTDATTEDERGLAIRMLESYGETTPGHPRPWWWHRIPRTGPIREDLEKYFGGGSNAG